MDAEVWTEVGKIAENETDGEVSAAVEMLCREALAARVDKKGDRT